MTAAVALAAAAVPPSVCAQPDPASAPLLDVPYLPQSEALCGGAAIAMVMRYWGKGAVYAETFADLVDADARGIRGSELMRALEGRGFDAVSLQGDAAGVQALLAQRRPPIALIEDRPGRFHYVVIVGWRGDRVIVHDPARAPYRVLDADAFTRAWSASRFWTLVAAPKAGLESAAAAERIEPSMVAAPSAEGAPRPTSVCAGLVEEGIRLAATGEPGGAQHVLEIAASDCVGDPAPWRELAGLRALRGEWQEAAGHARRALDRDPNDQHSARILATSLFLEGREGEALEAWNRLGVPIVDLVDIHGLERTRYAVAAAALDLRPETLLTARRLARARRRLDALPSVMSSRVTYEPGEDDRAKIVAAALERPLVPSGPVPLAAMGIRAATDRQLMIGVASPTGGGELWTGSWRWWEKRPRVAFGVAAPSPIGGVWSLEAFAERQTYGLRESEISERRRGVTLTGSDWISGATRIAVGGALDRWTDGKTASLLGGIEHTFAEGLGVAAMDGILLFGARRTFAANVTVDWRSALSRTGAVWHARAGFSGTGSNAPLALLPGAGTGQGRDVLLRAHPLTDDGVIRGVFGRRLAHAGAEWRYWSGPVLRAVHIAPAVFVDAAKALAVPRFGDGRGHMDAGVGIRVAWPGAGVLRIDLARGLRDGRTALSVGWTR